MDKRYPRTIMCTACIPWDEHFNFDEALFRKQIKLLTDNGMRSVYIFGTAGEGYAVSREQYQAIVKVFLDQMGQVPDSLPMVGVISLSMSEIMERIQIGMELGARDFQISFPSWGAVTPEEGMAFIRDVCRNFPQARFMHYNNGLRSKTRLDVRQYQRLCDEVPNIVAVKHPVQNIMEAHDTYYSVELPLEFYIMDYIYGYASLYHDCSLLISVCGLDLNHAWGYFNAGKRRDAEAITRYHDDFLVIHRELFKRVPVGKIDSAYDKFYVKNNIPEFPLRLYPPYISPTDEDFRAFIDAVKPQLPHWKFC